MSNENFLNSLDEICNEYGKAMREIEKISEDKWNSLSKEDQLDYFCAVVRRIHQGELVDEASYRGVLYGNFGFGLEAYAQAQQAGYLEIHNSIYSADYEKKLLMAFAKKIKPDITDEEAEKEVKNFFTRSI